MGRNLKSGSPTFNHPSWNHSLFGATALINPYYWGDYYNTLQNRVTTAHDAAVKAFRRLVQSANPEGSHAVRLGEWADTIEGYARAITYSEADTVAVALDTLATEIRQQVERERVILRNARAKAQLESEETDSSEDDTSISNEDFASFMSHSVSTAKSRPRERRAKKTAVIKSAAQLRDERWRDKQRSMASQCSNPIKFGDHPVDQDSVLRQLGPYTGSVYQYRDSPANTHRRILISDDATFWTDGLSHDQRRRVGNFSVYRQVGYKSQFTYVSGRKLDEDPN